MWKFFKFVNIIPCSFVETSIAGLFFHSVCIHYMIDCSFILSKLLHFYCSIRGDRMLKKQNKNKTELDTDDSFITTDWNASFFKKKTTTTTTTLISHRVKHKVMPSLIATCVNAQVRQTFLRVIQLSCLLAIKSTKSSISFVVITLVWLERGKEVHVSTDWSPIFRDKLITVNIQTIAVSLPLSSLSN